ncbi:glycoside hydrolase family 88 protein [Kribbella sp. WER1]
MTDSGRRTPTDQQTQLRSVADSLLALPYETWSFGDSVAFEAMAVASDRLDDPTYAAFARGWMRGWATRAEPFRRLDCTAPGLAMVRAAVRYDDDQLLGAAVKLADYLIARPTVSGVFATWDRAPLLEPYGPATLHGHDAALQKDPPPGVFVDCLHFDPAYLVALGATTAQERYWRTGLDQALGYVRLLQQDNGLFDHFFLAGDSRTFGPGWGRGQGWALLGLLDVLESARDVASAPALEPLVVAARRLIGSMTELQRADGHWYAVVTDPSSGRESSTAAFMAVAFRRAEDVGLIPPGRVSATRAAASSAAEAVRASLQPDGTLADVSAAVWACTEPSHYRHVPRGFRVPWGQGPAVLALGTRP